MKFPCLLALTLFIAAASQSAPTPPAPPSAGASATAEAQQPVNYAIRVEWKDSRAGTNALELVACDGNFNLDTIAGMVKVGESEVPTTVKMSGSLDVLNSEKGRLQLFLGRTVPYVTSTGSAPQKFSSYSQMSVGLNSRFVVTFGKPLVVQSENSGAVTILVKRLE
jgi:hypothetical protein